MLTAHVLPNVITYNAAISASEKARQLHQARQWRPQALGPLATMQTAPLLPNLIAHSAAISARGKARQRHQARQWQQALVRPSVLNVECADALGVLIGELCDPL